MWKGESDDVCVSFQMEDHSKKLNNKQSILLIGELLLIVRGQFSKEIFFVNNVNAVKILVILAIVL